MSSDDSVSVERKIEHRLFLVSVWIKGIAGLVQTVSGLLLLLIPQTGLNAFVIALTAPELAEDPTDRVATFLQRMVHDLAADTKLFVSAYLIVHGVIKVFLVAGLLGRRLWSYPVSLPAPIMSRWSRDLRPGSRESLELPAQDREYRVASVVLRR